LIFRVIGPHWRPGTAQGIVSPVLARFLGGGFLLAVLAAILVAGYVFAFSDGFPPTLNSGGSQEETRDVRPDADVEDARAVASDTAAAVWRAARGYVVISIAAAVIILFTRARARRGRRYVRLRLVPFRAEATQPQQVRRLLENWHQQLLERWWRRLPLGQRGISLEISISQDEEGEPAARLTVICPAGLETSVEGSLLACYPDTRLEREVPLEEELSSLRQMLRLKKRYPFVRALRAPMDDDPNVIDAVLHQMASLGQPAVLQYALVPAPAVFDHYSRWRFTSAERRSERARRFDPDDPGRRSELLGQELEGGLRVQYRSLFFVDIRVAAQSFAVCRSIAGVLRGESAGENRLVERVIRSWGRGRIYRKRMVGGTGNPIAGWSRSVYSSAELSGLWHFPSPGLKRVRIARSPIPRIPAPPSISRLPEHALVRDEYGEVGIRPEDKSDGLGLIGGQKTGKTSALCRTVRADGLDPDCAMIVLMPKPGDALKALSMIPPERTVHYLDLEKPEFGINPLRADGDVAMVADKIVDAFRDVNAEGDIKGSSDRYLRQSAQAAIGASRMGAIEGDPTLWHMYRVLIPAEHAFREHIVESISLEPRYADTATFFGRDLPSDLEGATSQTVAKLDAPRNKLLRLLVESLDKVLRHPRQLELDDVVRNREVLIVDGKMGTFGADNCRVMMQFILNMLYGTLQRQQQLPESQRVRVALKVDEAHLIINDSFADAMATLRSGGLEVVAAWQYGEQIQDPKIRAGMMSLLRQRCMFSMGEEADARELSSIAMPMYSDMIRPEADSRALLPITPDTIFNLPNHHAVCSWISRGARAPAFIGQTIPLKEDEAVIRHHLEAQRARGGFVPDRMPDPLPDVDWKGLRELPSEVIAEEAANGSGDTEPATAAGVALDFDPGATSVEESRQPAPQSGAILPETWTELDLDDVRGLVWDQVTPLPPDRRREPLPRELEILAALSSYRFLFASQIWRRWWRGSSLRAAQQTLNRMHKAGWVRRFKLQVGERGAQQRVYCITRLGFELAQAQVGRRGHYIDPGLKWREPVVTDAGRILRSLHVNGWVMAFESRAGKAARGWRGPRESRLDPPRKKVRGEWVEIAPRNVIVGTSHKLRDFEPASFESVSPDATVDLQLQMGDSRLRFDVLVELDRARSAAASEERLRRYDGLISGWSGMLERYKTLGTPPLVVFVCEDEPSALALVRIADRTVTARLAKPGTEETDWPHPGRRAMFFAVERDIHQQSLQAFQLPEFPPAMRERLHGRKARPCRPQRVHIVEPRLLDMH
jgi:hypothetical protein